MLKYLTQEQLDEIVKLSREHEIFREEQKKAGNEVYESPATESIKRMLDSIGYKGWYELWLLYFLGSTIDKGKKIDWMSKRKMAWENVETMVRDTRRRGRDDEYSMLVYLPHHELVKQAFENIENDGKIEDEKEKLARLKHEIFAEYESETENRESLSYSVILEEAVSYIERLVQDDPKNALLTRLVTALDRTKDTKEEKEQTN